MTIPISQPTSGLTLIADLERQMSLEILAEEAPT
jgi:hypothetical protein